MLEILSGWNARVFLHEYDHLQGIVYMDIVRKDRQGRIEIYEDIVWRTLLAEKKDKKDKDWLQHYGYKFEGDES